MKPTALLTVLSFLALSTLPPGAGTAHAATICEEMEAPRLYNVTPLMQAAYAGHTAKARRLLDEGADVNATSKGGTTALLLATIGGHEDMVRLLLAAGAAPDAADDGEWRTPLLCACACWRANRDYGISLALLQAGADIHVQDQYGDSALSHLVTAHFAGDSPAISDYLRQTLDFPKSCSPNELGLLMVDDPQNTDKLLACGADIDARDGDGRTPLMHMARSPWWTWLVGRLADMGADVNARDDYGNTAMMFAAMNGGLDNLILLKRHGAKVDVANSFGRTPLILAAMHGHWQAVSFCLQNGCDVNARDERGRTALMYAVEKCEDNPRVAAILLRAGADANAADSSGATALSIARALQYENAASLLRAYGAK